MSQFSKRECIKYFEIQDERTGKTKCECGRPKADHAAPDLVVITDRSLSWTPEACTRRLPTDAYGEIEFAEDTKTRKPFVRMSHDTQATMVLRLLQEKWGLEVPTLVISVTGGAKSFHLRPKLKAAFSKGLIKAAVSTGAWIITGGTNAGVMKHVGEAIKSRSNLGLQRTKINVIGVAPWGTIDNAHKLCNKEGRGLYPAYYSMETVDSGKASLDCNHSHFILVDNGTEGKYGVEIGLRSRIEGAISKYMKTESHSRAGAIGVPIVMLCLEGGPNTIKTMSEAIKKGVPAVVIDGSGRAADVVALAYRHLVYDETRQVMCVDYDYVDELKRKVEDVFGKNSRDRVFMEIEEMLQDENMVTIFRLEDERGSQDLDLAILKSLLKANHASFSAQLKLALAWNRIDVATSEIFTEELKIDNFKAEYLDEPMLTALLDNKPDFVALFLNEGLSLRQFLTLDVLIALYSGIPSSSPMKVLLIKQLTRNETTVIDMQTVGTVMEDLMGDRFKSRYKHTQEYFSRQQLYTGAQENPLVSDSDAAKTLPNPSLDLFTWAVLANRHHLAHLIWKRGRDNLASALMASKLLKSLASKSQNIRELTDLTEDILTHARMFEKIAVGVLDECRRQDDNLAQTIIMKELPDFGHLTCLDIAVSAENQDFIAHTSCQALLSRLWMGALVIDTPTWKVVGCIFLPFAIYNVISFHEDEERLVLADNDSRSNSVVSSSRTTKNDFVTNSQSNLGSLHSMHSLGDFADDPPAEHVDLEEYTDKHDVMSRLGNLEEPDDQVDITMRRASLGYMSRIMRFYQAPYVKFAANVMSYFLFLGLYSYIILTKFRLKPHQYEYVLQAWVLSLMLEEIRQLISQEPKNLFNKTIMYFGDPWNIVDFISLTSFIVATVLRYLAYYMDKPDYLIAARIIMATDVVIFIVRLLQIFSVNKNLGPKLVMIRKMLTDLKYFVCVLFVFVIGYGIARQAVLYPNSSLGTAAVGVVNRPYWQMYGELFVDETSDDEKNCTTGLPVCMQAGEEPCSDDYGKWVAPIYTAIYMLFTNILLLNLLIAIFNYTFEKVQEDSDKVWKFQRYDLILEYHDRPSFSPPLIIVSHLYMVIRWLLQKCRCCGCEPRTGSSMKMKLSATESEQLSLWEFSAAEAYCHHTTVRESETLDQRVKSIYDTVYVVSDGISTMMTSGEMMLACKQTTDALPVNRPETQAGKRIVGQKNRGAVETRLEKLEENVDRILELLIQQNQRQAAAAARPRSKAQKKQPSYVTSLHMKARQTPYPGSAVQRFKVTDDLVAWEVSFPSYAPVVYTSPIVLARPVWADPDIMSISPRPTLEFNQYDSSSRISRKSFVGDYKVVDGMPRNPMGRTGVIGRGNLGRWGPNHAADPIVTRWKRASSGILLDKGKRVLEFIAIQRKDNQQWAIPGGMVDAGQKVTETLRNEFSEEALAKLDMPLAERQRVVARIEKLFEGGVEVYQGYVDDPRNTDMSWMETVAYNFHDDSGEIFGNLELKAGDDAQAVRWQRVSGNIPLYASHVGILEKVSEMHGAAFY